MAAVDLLKKVGVKAIIFIGPMTSAEADFAIDLGTKAQVPIISFSATSPSLNSTGSPYFIRTTLADSSQTRAISAFVRAFGWREFVPIYEKSDYGNGLVPFLADASQEIDAAIPYLSVIPSAATDDQILVELYELMSMQTRVFVVHMSTSLGSRLFSKAHEFGLVSEGYAWIITDGLTGLLDSLDSSVIDSMQGVIGVKPYIPTSKELDNFTVRWKRKILLENPSIREAELSILGLRAYDAAQARAMAVERVGAMESNFQRPKSINQNSQTYVESLGVFRSGPKLLEAVLNTTFKGLSGEFHLVNGQLQPSVFQIINVVGGLWKEIGFWTPASGLSLVPSSVRGGMYSASTGNLSEWRPGRSTTKVTGFCIDVFDAVRQRLPYAIPHKFVSFEDANGKMAGAYNDLIYQVHLQLRAYNSPEEYADALSKGSRNGGVSAIFDVIPCIRLFLRKHCGQYMMVGPTYKTGGFGFVFPRGSPLVPDFSRAILNVTESDQMMRIEQKWFGSQTSCSDTSTTISSNSLTLDSFWGLFLIAGAASALALFVFTARFLYQHWHVPVTSEYPVVTFRRRIAHLAERFDGRDLSSHTWRASCRQPDEGVEMGPVRDDAPPAQVNPLRSPTSVSNDADSCPADGGDTATPSEPDTTPARCLFRTAPYESRSTPCRDNGNV
ncbi:hypothetical protein ACLOJK_030600 [Asimina triloba]